MSKFHFHTKMQILPMLGTYIILKIWRGVIAKFCSAYYRISILELFWLFWLFLNCLLTWCFHCWLILKEYYFAILCWARCKKSCAYRLSSVTSAISSAKSRLVILSELCLLLLSLSNLKPISWASFLIASLIA